MLPKGLVLPMHRDYLPGERKISLLSLPVEQSAFFQGTLKLRIIFMLVREQIEHLCIYLGIYTRLQWCTDLEMFLYRKKSVLVNRTARNYILSSSVLLSFSSSHSSFIQCNRYAKWWRTEFDHILN